MELKEHERIDDLNCSGFRILQNETAFCFGMDAVLLSGFARAGENDRVVDFCTGTGILPLLMLAKKKGSSFTALELQPAMADMAARSVELNGVSDSIRVICGDVREASRLLGMGKTDVITCNPPYIPCGSGIINPDSPKAIARHEVCLNFAEMTREAARVLKAGGKLFLVHRPERLAELIATLRESRLEPKRIRMVHPFLTEPANMVLIEAVKDGGVQMIVEPPLIINEAPGVYTKELKEDYGF